MYVIRSQSLRIVLDPPIEGTESGQEYKLEVLEAEREMKRARDLDWTLGPLIGGFTYYPYQVAVGMTLRYWEESGPMVRVHLGPFKAWVCWVIRGKRNQD